MSPMIDFTKVLPAFAQAANHALSKSKVNHHSLMFGDFVLSRYLALKQDKHLALKGKNAGLALELLIADSLCKFGVALDRIHMNIKADAKNADADIFVTPKTRRKAVLIMAKTSLRERWKQPDRDAIIFTYDMCGCWKDVCNQVGISEKIPPEVWAVTVREDEKITPEKAVRHARRMGDKAMAIDEDKFLSVFDIERMEKMLEACL